MYKITAPAALGSITKGIDTTAIAGLTISLYLRRRCDRALGYKQEEVLRDGNTHFQY
jgi:hypothetical protein